MNEDMEAKKVENEKSIKKTELIFGICCLLVTPLQMFVEKYSDPYGPHFILFVVLPPVLVLGFINIVGVLLIADSLFYFWKNRNKKLH